MQSSRIYSYCNAGPLQSLYKVHCCCPIQHKHTQFIIPTFLSVNTYQMHKHAHIRISNLFSSETPPQPSLSIKHEYLNMNRYFLHITIQAYCRISSVWCLASYRSALPRHIDKLTERVSAASGGGHTHSGRHDANIRRLDKVCSLDS